MQITYPASYLRAAKRLLKKYRNLQDDVDALALALEQNPKQGSPLGRNCYKVRMAITSKGQGKSGSARVITCVKILADRIVILTIYDKSEREDLVPGELDVLLLDAGLE